MNPDQRPIAIIGCPRSGTTLLRRLFDAHPHISCPGESFVLRGAARFLAGERVAEDIDYGPLGGLSALGFSRDEIKDKVCALALSFHQQIAQAEGKPRVAIKTAVDAFYLPAIYALFADKMKYVCIVRHGADVAVSLREFTATMEGVIEELMPFVQQHRRLLSACAGAWAKVTTDMLDLAERYRDHVIAVRYEDLVQAPAEVLGEVFSFLNAPCDIEAVMAEAFRPADVRGLGDYKTYATGQIEKSSAGRWKMLPHRALAEMAPIINPVLQRAGYDTLDDFEAIPDSGMRRHELAMMFHSAQRASGGDHG
jgi:hypothetical protein